MQQVLVGIYYLQIVTKALNNLQGELSGKYYPLSKMTEAEQEQLINVSHYCGISLVWRSRPSQGQLRQTRTS